MWEEQGAFNAVDNDASRPKYYLLEMLPYPSGTLHMGHMRNYTIGDAVARYKRMCGFNVLHPMGWDAFGLPAENAAIKHGTPPREWTEKNIEELKAVLRAIWIQLRLAPGNFRPAIRNIIAGTSGCFCGCSRRASRYRKKSKVNWCPACHTVLANEQVIDGFCWQHETTLVEAKELEQWFLRITQYSDELLDDMEELEGGWPERVLIHAAELDRQVARDAGDSRWRRWPGSALEVFTTRVDTIYGASAIADFRGASDAGPLLEGVPGQNAMKSQLKAMRQKNMRAADIATAEKEGFFTGRFAVNPFSGEQIPIWVANFVLAEYGTGAVMAFRRMTSAITSSPKNIICRVQVVVQPRTGRRCGSTG